MKPIKIEEQSFTNIFEKTQLNILKKNTNMLTNDMKRSPKGNNKYNMDNRKKMSLTNNMNDSKNLLDPSSLYNNDYSNNNNIHKYIKLSNEDDNSRTPSNTLANMPFDIQHDNINSFYSMNNMNNVHPNFGSKFNNNPLFLANKNNMHNTNNPLLNLDHEHNKQSFMNTNNNNVPFKNNNKIFVDDNLTESAVSILSENETEELKSFQNVSLINSRSNPYINNIIQNSFMQYVKKFQGNNTMPQPFNNNAIPNHFLPMYNMFNYPNAQYQNMQNVQNMQNNIMNRNAKFNFIENKRKKYLYQDKNVENTRKNALSEGNIYANVDNGKLQKVDGRKKRRYHKSKNTQSINTGELTTLTNSNSLSINNMDKFNKENISSNMNNNHNPFVKNNIMEEKNINAKNSFFNDSNTNILKEESKVNIKKCEDTVDEEQIYCPVCKSYYEELSDGSPADGLNWIGCDKCEKWYHWICCKYSVDNPPDIENDWYCNSCLNS